MESTADSQLLHNVEKGVSQNAQSERKPDVTNAKQRVLYNVGETPPFPITLVLAVQQSMKMIPPMVSTTTILALAICADRQLEASLLSTMIFMVSVTTFLQSIIGFRLPVKQGPFLYHILVVVNRFSSPEDLCDNVVAAGNLTTVVNGTDTSTYSIAEYRLQQTVLSFVAASGVHMLIGFSGIIGYITRFVGPATVVPPIILLALDFVIVFGKLVSSQWLISILCMTLVIVCTILLSDVFVPFPSWSRSRGLYITRYKAFRMFGFFVPLVFCWLLCYILTETKTFSSDPKDPSFLARTDQTRKNIAAAPWFYFPYPGQFGPARFDIDLFIGFTVGVFTSVLDSVADYMATARQCGAPSPPAHAVNRGLFVEGLCSMWTGALGGSHGTTTFCGLVGDMILTGVFSRAVMQVSSAILMVLAIFGKTSGLLISIPQPIVGSLGMISIASLLGTQLEAASTLDLRKPRNNVAVAVPIVVGYLTTSFVKNNSSMIDFGSIGLTRFMVTLIGNPLLVAGCLGCILDNLLPDKDEIKPEADDEKSYQMNDIHVYSLPWIMPWLRRQRWSRYIPMSPTFGRDRI